MSVSDNILKGLPGEPTLQGDLDLKDSDQSTTLFKVARDTGNTTIAGTAAITGAVTMASTLAVTGALSSGAFTPSSVVRTGQKRLYTANAKAGTTSGWVVNAGDNLNSLARLPASQTSSTLVIPLDGLKVGDTITAFHLVGQVESAGGNVTIDAALRKQSAAAADLTDASVGAMTQLALTGGTAVDTILSAANTAKTALADVVGADESFYMLITGTTAGSTDIDLMGVAITVTEA